MVSPRPTQTPTPDSPISALITPILNADDPQRPWVTIHGDDRRTVVQAAFADPASNFAAMVRQSFKGLPAAAILHRLGISAWVFDRLLSRGSRQHLVIARAIATLVCNGQTTEMGAVTSRAYQAILPHLSTTSIRQQVFLLGYPTTPRIARVTRPPRA